MIRLDTHVVVWLYSGDVDRLSGGARELIESNEPVISPAVELELTFLHEIERLTVTGADIVADLRERIGLSASTETFGAVVAAAASLHWTRDPFDRLIVADALASGASLITKDAGIRDQCRHALW